jgi:hypothetical protein
MIYGIVTLVTIESGNFSRRVSDCQGASAAAECSHTVLLVMHVLPVWQTCPPSAPNREQRSQDPQFQQSACEHREWYKFARRNFPPFLKKACPGPDVCNTQDLGRHNVL